MVKTFKILLLCNPLADVLETWYVDWALAYYHVCSNDDPRLTFDLFAQRSTLVLYAFVWGKA